MAWDIERTKQLLLDAGTREFCDFGLAGARVDRIAERAGVNKERIYQYFGKKDAFFDVVVAHALEQVVADVPLIGSGAEALGDYAGRLFDRHRKDRTVVRLLFWEGLERGDDVAFTDARAAHHARKVDQVAAMLPGIPRAAAAELLLSVISLVDAWVALPQIDALLAGASPDRAGERRDAIVASVACLARAAEQSAL